MVPSETKTPIKMAGYLQKKSKMKVVSRWKKLWFVLEGRLLLYYKSQLEYLSLSPCRGTVNMGLAASVLPGTSQEIIISTRSHTVSLKALSKADNDVWLQALIDAMCLPNSNHARCCSKPMNFRYSVDHYGYENPYQVPHASTLPIALPIYSKSSLYNDIEKKDLRERYRPSGSLKTEYSIYGKPDVLKKSSKVALSDTSIPGKFITHDTIGKAMRRSYSVDDEVNKYGENIYESLKSTGRTDHINTKPKRNHRVNRSDSDCLFMTPKERLLRNMNYYASDDRKINMAGKTSTPIGRGIRERRFSTNDDQWALGCSKGYGMKVRSDTDLPSFQPKYQDQYLSSSCDFANLRELIKEKTNAPLPLPRTLTKRSNSFLKHFSSEKRNTGRRRLSVKKRSLSFLKKIWCRRESNKWEPKPIPRDYMPEMEGPNSDLDVMTDMSDHDVNSNYINPRPEPPPDYDNFNVSEDEYEKKNVQKMRYIKNEPKRTCSPWHDNVPKSDSPQPLKKSNSSWSLEAPELPPKTNLCIDNARDLLSQDTDNGISRLFAEDVPKIVSELRKDYVAPLPPKRDELTEMLESLTALNKSIFTTSLYQNTKDIYEEAKRLRKRDETKKEKEDPDYDIPRPHTSLLPSIKRNSIDLDSMQATRFFTGNYEDSLDVVRAKDDLMAPDSLECDPWALNGDIDLMENSWPYYQHISVHPMALDSIYQDSLNPTIAPISDYLPRNKFIRSLHNLRIS